MYADISPEGDRITLDLSWQETELLKLVPGARYDTKKKMHHLPPTWSSMILLRGIFGEHFTYSEALTQFTWRERINRVDPSLEMRGVIEWPVADELLRPFQRVGVEWMKV